MNIAAVDPGASGGIALLVEGIASASGLPPCPKHLAAVFAGVDLVVIEDVPCYTGKNIPSNTTFKLGKSCGAVEAIARVFCERVEMVRPQAWQKGVEMKREKGEKQDAWKRRLRARAQELFPDLKVTLKTADALLMLDVGRRFE